MDNRAVIFGKDGVRILHGINPDDYKGRTDVLINPTYPRGLSPDQWKLVNGQIEGALKSTTKADYSKLYYALAFLAGYLLHILVRAIL